MDNMLSATNFAFWLKGYFELTGSNTLNENQVEIIKEHLNLVFTKVTKEIDPQVEHKEGKQATCDGIKINDLLPEPFTTGRATHLTPNTEPKVFC